MSYVWQLLNKRIYDDDDRFAERGPGLVHCPTHNKLGDRSFSAAGPRLWNDLPPGLGGRDLPSTPSDNLWKLIYLATEALSGSFECIGAI